MVTPCQLFAVSDSEAMAALPKLFQDVTSELVAAYEVGPKPVVATALAISAAALGGSVTVQVPQFGRHVTPAFNLGLLLLGGRSPGWLNLLRARLFGLIIDMQLVLTDQGVDALQKRINTLQQAFEEARRTISPDPELLRSAADDIARQKAGLRPALFTARFAPADVGKVIDASFDNAVFLADPGADPVETFLELKKGEQRDLVRLLNSSWEGLPLNFGQRVVAASLSLLWESQEEMLLPLFDSDTLVGALPPPILWISSPTNRLRGAKHGIASERQWKHAIDTLFDCRCRHRLDPSLLSDEAAALLGEFEREIEGRISENGPLLHRHLVWLPGLALRVAVIFAFFNERKDLVIPADAATAAVLVVRWLAAEHLRILLTFDAAPLSPGADMSTVTDRSDPAEVMLRKIRQKAPVTRRKLWQSYNDPKALTFQSVLDGLLRDGKVAKDSSERFVPVESGGSAVVMAVEERGDLVDSSPL